MNDDIILFFDGCHKLYYVHESDIESITSMHELGWGPEDYNSFDMLPDYWDASCPLRFVSPASLDEHMPSIPQFAEEDGQVDIAMFMERVRRYYYERNTGSSQSLQFNTVVTVTMPRPSVVNYGYVVGMNVKDWELIADKVNGPYIRENLDLADDEGWLNLHIDDALIVATIFDAVYRLDEGI